MKPVRAIIAAAAAVLLAVPGAQAQKLKERMADRYAEVFDYPHAVVVYEDIVASGKATPDDYRKLAEAYQRTGALDKAATTYAQLLTMGTPSVQDMRAEADLLRALGRYAEAMTWYQRIAHEVPTDTLAALYANDPRVIERIQRDSTRNTVRTMPINSAEADLGVAVMDDLLIFSSARGEGVGGKNEYKWDDQPFLNLYSALLKGASASEPMVMRRDVNSRYHDGTAAYDSTNHRLYFTRDNYFYGTLNKAKDGQLKLGIFFSDISKGEFGQKEWGNLAEFEHNDPEYNTGHPAIAANGRRLYFVSDRPGGLGGTDIWYCNAVGRTWGEPVNMGAPVNTPGNEMYPFVSRDSVLYFTSNGHPGLGGYDMFSCRLTPQGMGKVFNLGYPVNTRSNDIGLVLLRDDSTGFFVSDRPGGKGSDDIYGCTIRPPSNTIRVRVIEKGTGNPIGEAVLDVRDDAGRFMDDAHIEAQQEPGRYNVTAPYKPGYVISAAKNGYKQNVVEVDPAKDDLDNVVVELEKYDYAAEGLVMHGETLQPIAGAKVTLCDASDQVLEEVTTGADGHYAFALKAETDYRLKVDKDGFFKQSARISTKGKPSTVIRTDFKLFPLEVDQVVRLDNIYYDLAKWNIRPDAAKELDKLVQTLLDNPTVTIELSSHTDCRGKDAYNMSLSEKRAKSAVEYVVKHGIAKERITSKGYGETKPVETCECTKCTEDQHQRNRRTEFKVLSK